MQETHPDMWAPVVQSGAALELTRQIDYAIIKQHDRVMREALMPPSFEAPPSRPLSSKAKKPKPNTSLYPPSRRHCPLRSAPLLRHGRHRSGRAGAEQVRQDLRLLRQQPRQSRRLRGRRARPRQRAGNAPPMARLRPRPLLNS